MDTDEDKRRVASSYIRSSSKIFAVHLRASVCIRGFAYLRSFAFICGFVLLSCVSARAADVVERRGDEPAVRGQILEVGDAGVWIRTEAGGSRWISWDRVRRVEASSQMLQQSAAEHEELADDLWRARTRVERNDPAIAEPIFEKYLERYRGQTNETALVIAEGLLRCYLAREARVLALIPAMEVARLRAANVASISYSTLPRVMDEQTLLCPWLAPVWTGSLGLARLERALVAYESDENEVIAAIAALYRRSVLAETGAGDGGGPAMRVGAVRHPGVELLRDLVASVDGSSDGRRAARVRLERRISSGELAEHGAWAEAWARYHIGRSLLNERSEGLQQRGLINLAHVPARFGASQPYLAGLALAHISAWHDAAHDAEAAASLRAELARRYPNHPALQEGFALERRDADEG